MDIPRGHAAMPLTEADFLDFIYNYFKAEYAPIRSFWSTATADPRQLPRWINMGHEMSPLVIRPANAQAQKDLESLDYFTRKWNLDASFVRGLVIRFAKYEVHERMEKKLFECARLDLMVRKALKEKHLIDAMWPSPAPRSLSRELLEQGVQVRKWYGDMFNKYFRVLHSVDEFELRPEVDQRIKSSGTLMLVPFVDHLVFGAVDPIMPIVAKGAGYSNAKSWKGKDAGGSSRSDGYGEPGKFEIRFDAPPGEVQETYTKSVVRQCQCNKCGTKKDVQVVVSIDPSAGGGAVTSPSTRKPSGSNATGQRRHASKTSQRYAPGYNMPTEETAPRQPPRPQPQPEEPARASTPEQKKQCPRCTFLNHRDLTECEMCQAALPNTTIEKPPSPAAVRISHSHSASLPPPPPAPANAGNTLQRPAGLNRHSLSSTLFSIFPFSQQEQQEHHAKLPATQPSTTDRPSRRPAREEKEVIQKPQPQATIQRTPPQPPPADSRAPETARKPSTPPNLIDDPPSPELSRPPEMAMMPMTPPPTSSTSKRPAPAGLPSNLMDDFVPVSPGFVRDEEEEDAGWGEMSREEARSNESDSDEEEDDGKGGKRKRKSGVIDLDEVAREEADVWGERED